MSAQPSSIGSESSSISPDTTEKKYSPPKLEQYGTITELTGLLAKEHGNDDLHGQSMCGYES